MPAIATTEACAPAVTEREVGPSHLQRNLSGSNQRRDRYENKENVLGALSVERDCRGDEGSGDHGAILDKRKQRCADVDRDRTGELLVQGRRGARPDRVGQRARRQRGYL